MFFKDKVAVITRGAQGIGRCIAEEFQYAMNVGVTAPFYLTKLFAPYFTKNAAIVNISSSRDRMSQPQMSYTAAKGGIAAFTHALLSALQGRYVSTLSPQDGLTQIIKNTSMMKQSLSNSLLMLACIFLCVMTACSQVQSNDIVAEGETPVKVSGSYSFTEGPASDARGDVFFTDQPNNKIYHWDCESGKITLFTNQSGRSNGMYFDAQGNLIACADMDNQLWSFDMKGNSKILVTNYREKLLNGPNDVWISKDGGYYLTDPYFKRDYWKSSPYRQQPVEGLYYLTPGGKQLIMLDSTLNQPNGLVGTPDGKHLYVAEAKASRILKYDIQPNGHLTNRQVFANMGSDGMTIDDRGNIYLTGDGVTVFDKDGHEIAHFPISEDWTSNVCFGGKERDILFITASKSVYTLKMLVHGVK